MTSTTDPHKEKQNTQHRKLKCQATQTPHKQKTSNTDTHPPDLPQTKAKYTTQKTKMTSNTDTHPSDPPQTKTKHTTQKTKMTRNTDPHKEKQNTQHRKLK